MHDAGDRNHRILLAAWPVGVPEPGHFGSDVTAVPTPGPGQLLLRTIYLSLDPAHRRAMQAGAAAAERLNPGDVMPGETVSQVLESRHPEYRPGEFVVSHNGWQQFALSSGQGMRRLDPGDAPISTALGVLGMPGLAGYMGLVYLGEPRPGQSVVVSAATGPVGGTAGQAARLMGARAIGIASSNEKCAYAVNELGYSACINYRSGALGERLAEVCPNGVDVYFDNAGGDVLTAVLHHLAPHARIILCGMNEAHHLEAPLPGSFLGPLIAARATLRGVVAEDHLPRLPELVRVVGSWIRNGQFRYREDLSDGLASAPAAFCRLLRGENFGKVLVRVAAEHL
ncbi:MAG TPA: NADP-dependent oxidoreductase [Steroidobacteraceae bacterium]|nr:NADP-dependent oxidoreductase [Steroidobacteraceae bacterium]